MCILGRRGIRLILEARILLPLKQEVDFLRAEEEIGGVLHLDFLGILRHGKADIAGGAPSGGQGSGKILVIPIMGFRCVAVGIAIKAERGNGNIPGFSPVGKGELEENILLPLFRLKGLVFFHIVAAGNIDNLQIPIPENVPHHILGFLR